MQQIVEALLTQINRVVLGKNTETKLALACLLAKGHLLIEDLPGMGKTTLAHTLANVLSLSFQRVQFTSDLLPADVIGLSIYHPETQSFSLHKGAIFSQVLLADEINRASPKTQSALLEAMEEKQVSIDGQSYALPAPFFVIATQNPTFHAGTYPLPESQLDRFTMRLSLGFPPPDAEKQLLRGENNKLLAAENTVTLTVENLLTLQQNVCDVHASESLLDYVIALCQVTRQAQFAGNPLSPRAGLALLNCAKAWAYIENRNYVIPEDVQAVFHQVCQHRMANQSEQLFEHSASTSLAEQVLLAVDPTQF
jgi:MoxR-like ATPase